MLKNTMQQVVSAHAKNVKVVKYSALRFYFTAATCNIVALNNALAKYKFCAAHMHSTQYVVTHAASNKFNCDDCTTCTIVKCYNNIK